MRRFIIKYYLFLLAYLPLYLIVAVKAINEPIFDSFGNLLPLNKIVEQNLFSALLTCLFLVLLFSFLIYTKLIFRAQKGNRLFEIKKISTQEEKYIEYLGTYILPFIALESKDIFDVIAFVLMFFTLGYIYIKTNLIYTNPTLTFFGFNLFKIVTKSGEEYDCLSKDTFQVGDEPTGNKLAHDTFILKKWTPQGLKK